MFALFFWFMQYLKIPYSKIKRIESHLEDLENKLNISITLRDNELYLEGDNYNEFIAKQVIEAIVRGFSFRDAMLLTKEGYMLRSINLKDFFGTRAHITRVKARVIGTEGTIKKQIEHSTDSIISIHGSHISIIASYDTMDYATEAIMKIIKGSKHSTVLNYLAKIKKEILWHRLKGN